MKCCSVIFLKSNRATYLLVFTYIYTDELIEERNK